MTRFHRVSLRPTNRGFSSRKPRECSGQSGSTDGLKNDPVVTDTLLQNETGRILRCFGRNLHFFVHKMRMKVVTWWES